MNPNCFAGTPLVSPKYLVENVCFQTNGNTLQGTKTVETVGTVTTVTFRNRLGNVVVGAAEVACPPEVMVVNQPIDVHVASFERVGDNLVLTQTDGTKWTVAGTFADVNVASAAVSVDGLGNVKVTLTQDDGGPAVAFTIPAPTSTGSVDVGLKVGEPVTADPERPVLPLTLVVNGSPRVVDVPLVTMTDVAGKVLGYLIRPVTSTPLPISPLL